MQNVFLKNTFIDRLTYKYKLNMQRTTMFAVIIIIIVIIIIAGAHQEEPPSPLIPWVNPFPSKFIFRNRFFPRKVS